MRSLFVLLHKQCTFELIDSRAAIEMTFSFVVAASESIQKDDITAIEETK